MSTQPEVATIDVGGGRTVRLGFETADDHILGVIRRTGAFYEAEMLADIRSRLFFPEVAVDVGAHVGNHTVYFAGVLGMATVAFEPNPASFGHLRTNVEVNGLGDRCVLVNAAVGSAEGRGRAVDGEPHNSGMARVEADREGAVAITALDRELAGRHRIDLVKIDVEGWEVEVVRGATEVLSRHRPLVYVESTRENFERLREDLAALGYVCWRRFNHTPTFLFLPRERFRV